MSILWIIIVSYVFGIMTHKLCMFMHKTIHSCDDCAVAMKGVDNAEEI